MRRKWTLRHRFVKALPSGFERPEFGAGAQEVFLPVGAMHRAISVSADRAAPAGPAHPRERPASRRGRAKSRETWTLRWREMDSNFRFRVRCKRGLRRKSPASAACSPSIICGCRRWPSAKAQSEISEPNPYRARNRKFESISLQERVSNKPGAATAPRRRRPWRAVVCVPIASQDRPTAFDKNCTKGAVPRSL